MKQRKNQKNPRQPQDWVTDIYDMHYKFGFHEWLEENQNNSEIMKKLLEFRLNFLEEELSETWWAFENNDPEEIVDGLIDLCVVAIGTLDLFDIDSRKAWAEIHEANMSKQRGIKEGRPNPFNLPDLVKPKDWKAPSHEGNHGTINKK